MCLLWGMDTGKRVGCCHEVRINVYHLKIISLVGGINYKGGMRVRRKAEGRVVRSGAALSGATGVRKYFNLVRVSSK